VVSGESQHEKEGAGSGDWVYLKDGSTLTALLKKEVALDLGTEEFSAGEP
jgi:frataxin